MSDDDAPIREALEQVERVLAHPAPPSVETRRECADVIRRVLDDYAVIAKPHMPVDHVSVPVAELQALRRSRGRTYRSPMVERYHDLLRVTEPLVDRIPEPPEWEPSTEQIEVLALTLAPMLPGPNNEPQRTRLARRQFQALRDAGLLREDSDHE